MPSYSKILIKTKSRVTNSRMKIKIKISSFKLENYNEDENHKLLTREFKSR